jgi:hypothetical protein
VNYIINIIVGLSLGARNELRRGRLKQVSGGAEKIHILIKARDI